MISTPAEPKASPALADPPERPWNADGWVELSPTCARSDVAADAVFDVPTSCQNVRPQLPGAVEQSFEQSGQRLLEQLQQSEPEAAKRLQQAQAAMPSVGEAFQGFQLLAELGRGAFARVFLAQQGDLASRLVVLKVSPSTDEEPQTLAQLQHTNVVPIYSVHRAGRLQAVCMPYFGAATLASVLRDLKTRKSLPNSGTGLVDTLVNCRSTVRVSGPGSSASTANKSSAIKSSAVPSGSKPPARGSLSDIVVKDATAAPVAAIGSEVILEGLRKFTYVDAVLWLGARLADGLAHAHEHGILHRDLKPANILLTDEGQPMLLDFNLAQDTKNRSLASAVIGGTLPYMSPEQIEAYRNQTSSLNYNSDIYSLGLILYELLTGRHPFDIPTGPIKQVLEKMLGQRRGAVPVVRPWNKTVSPAAEAIIRRCLEPDPNKRYQTARDLKEDLERHLANLPLRHAQEPSAAERARKWARRHPRLASSSSVAAAAGLVLVAVLGLLVVRSNRLATLEASDSFNGFLTEKKGAQFLLTSRSADREQMDEGLTQCRKALARYGVLENAAWEQSPAFRRLSAEEQGRLREAMGEMLLLMARSVSLQGGKQADQVRDALKLNELAESCFREEHSPRAVLMQRAELVGLLGDRESARKLDEQARRLPLRTARDHYLSATEHALRGELREAIPLLQQATRQDPQSFWAWCVLGICYDGLSRDSDAAACYSTCIALWPNFPWTHYNRGLAYLRQKDYKRAAADFDQVIDLRPNLTEAYINRALAKQGLENYKGALRDLTHALDLGGPYTRVYFLRARVREKLGDADGAKQDRAEGMRQEPGEEHSWVARGLARLPEDTKGALADFDKALALNPRSLAALQNKAHVLAKIGQNEAALAVANRTVELYPDFVPARAGRGVILARLNQREAAHKDAEDCLLRDNQPSTFYQLAGIYALTSAQQAEDRAEAYRLLSTALRRGFGFELLESDRDLEPIRGQPEFRRLVAVARAFQVTTAQATKQ